MQIKRETLAHGTDLEEMRVKLKEAAEAHTMGPAQGSNDYGPVYVNPTHDLRIERDAGNWGEYRVMLLHKAQPKTSLFSKLRRG